MADVFDKYLDVLQLIESEVTLESIAKRLNVDQNTLLVTLYEMKSLGWLDTQDIEKWKLTNYGLQAKSFLLENISNKHIEITPNNANLLVTFPREFGNLSNYFPSFLDTSTVIKNGLKEISAGDEILILSYAVDFKVLSQILEDPNIVPSGKERDFVCSVQYFHGFNEDEISNMKRNGFQIRTNKIVLSGSGHAHAKIIIFRGSKDKSAIISSANFTDNVFATRNLEIGLIIKEKSIIDELEKFFSWLWKRTYLG